MYLRKKWARCLTSSAVDLAEVIEARAFTTVPLLLLTLPS